MYSSIVVSKDNGDTLRQEIEISSKSQSSPVNF